MSSNSPRSEKCDTRFSTPVPELDDHRFQPHSLPRIDVPLTSQPRRATTRSGSVDQGPLQVDTALGDAGFTSRDFEHEHAVIDDDQSVNYETWAPPVRRDSVSPAMLRHGTNRRSRNRQDRLTRSRSSSSSSSSPPNSVEAFADPRRRMRANTLESKKPSELDLLRNRSGSIGTTHQLPPVSAGSVARETWKGEDELAKEDVCFPQYDEPGKTYTIDYEELEEFVASVTKSSIPDLKRHARRQSIGHTVDSKGFHMSKGSKSNTANPKDLEKPKNEANGTDEKLWTNAYTLRSSDETVQKTASPEKSQSLDLLRERFTFFSSESTYTYHAEDLGGLIGDGVNFRDLFELPPEGGVWWLDVVSPSEDEYWAIARAFGVHPLTSEDIIMQEDREKVELFKDYYLVCFRTFAQESRNGDHLEPVNIYMVVFREGVLSFSTAPNPHAAAVRKRMGKLRDYLSLGSDWICYAMIDSIVDSFAPVIRSAEHESEAIEDQVFVAREDDYVSLLRQIGDARKKVLNMMRLLGGKADVIKGFAKRCNESFSIAPRGDIGLYLGDIQDHVVTMMSNLGHIEKMLSRSHGNYLAQLNVDGVKRGHEANRVLAKITVIATVLVPMNFITGLFGMNVPVPGKNANQDNLSWFFGIIGVIAAFVIFSLLLARRMKYI